MRSTECHSHFILSQCNNVDHVTTCVACPQTSMLSYSIVTNAGRCNPLKKILPYSVYKQQIGPCEARITVQWEEIKRLLQTVNNTVSPDGMASHLTRSL